MNNFKFLFSCLFLMTLVSAYAFTDQKVKLNPDLLVIENNIGHGKEIGVKVFDERPEKTLGRRGAAQMSKRAEITTNQNVGEVFDLKIREGLTRKGFVPGSLSADSLRSLWVEIRSLTYYASTGFWTGGVHTKTSLKAIAKNAGKEYEQFYRGGNEERVMIVPYEEENEKLINMAISDILQKLFSDKALLEFLAK